MVRSYAGGAPLLDILLAALLRDMRTRFGRSYLSYLLAIAWPLGHLTIAFTAYVLTHKVAPVGDDPGIFAFTGLIPYILCLYPARFMAMTMLQNKPLLNFTVVRPIHLIVARAFLEALSALLAFSIFVIVLLTFGMATLPNDIFLVSEAVAAILFFSIAYGSFGILLVSINPNFGMLAVTFSIIGLYFTSGAVLPLEALPQHIQHILTYNPLFDAVGLMRCAYFSAYDDTNYSLLYIYFLGLCFTMLTLLSERLFRGIIL